MLIADLTLSYSFVDGGLVNAPDWAENARLSFTVNNLGDDFGETSVVKRVSSEGMVLAGGRHQPDRRSTEGYSTCRCTCPYNRAV